MPKPTLRVGGLLLLPVLLAVLAVLAVAFTNRFAAADSVAIDVNLIGKKIENFKLQDYLGSPHALSDWKEKPVVVVAFLGTECPVAKLYSNRLVELAAQFEKQGVQFVAIDSNQQDSLQKLTKFAGEHKIEFPLLKDPGNKVADQFGATRTPEVFLLDKDRVVRYWGAIDDQYTPGVIRPKAEQGYLAAALDQLLSDKPIAKPVTRSFGCYIGKVSQKEPTGEVTYSKQISRILNDHCVECHRAGQVAPFVLTSYDDTIGWAETIREVITQGRMPPWHADPKYGKFFNDARLPEVDKQLIFTWINNGMPEGNKADLPQPKQYDETWRIPKPDLIVKMPQPYTVPAKGVVPYQYFVVDPGFKEDVWIRGAECRPGNREVIHHMILFYLPPGQDTKRGDEALTHSVASFVPGMPAKVWSEQVARRIPAGSKLVFQMHYTPNGTEHTDQSEAGLVFADGKHVEKELQSIAALNYRFQIPPGNPDYAVEARYHFYQDMDLYSLIPHMHLRGKAMRFTAIYPDKTQEVLLDVPHYDFNWQNIYLLAEPKRMPEGAEIVVTCRFDNSKENPVNPDPEATVMWGDQTWQEMAIGSMSMSRADQNLTLGPPQVEKQADGKFNVNFRYKPPAGSAVDAVYLAGQFNDWKTDALKMEGPNTDGFYTATQPLTAGAQQYKYAVKFKGASDIAWKNDPGNPTQAGDYHNSVVQVGPVEAAEPIKKDASSGTTPKNSSP